MWSLFFNPSSVCDYERNVAPRNAKTFSEAYLADAVAPKFSDFGNSFPVQFSVGQRLVHERRRVGGIGPVFAAQHLMYMCAMAAKSTSKLIYGTARKKRPDFAYFWPSEFMKRILLCSFISIAAFLVPVAVVVAFGAEPKMFGPNAGRVIAVRAVVQDALSGWNWTVMKYPAGPMCGYGLRSAFWAYVAVAERMLGSGPYPACGRLSDFRPKSVLEVRRKALGSQKLSG